MRHAPAAGRYLALVIPLLVATAPAAAGVRTWTFTGDCSFTGAVHFDPPLTIQPTDGRGVALAHGTCTGALSSGGTTRRVTAAPARYWATDSSDQMSCELGAGTGRGSLTIAGMSAPFRLSETRAAAVALLQLRGHGWSGAGEANAGPAADPAAAAQDCAGTGVASIPLDIRVHAEPGGVVVSDRLRPFVQFHSVGRSHVA